MATDSKINYKYGIVSISFMSYDVLYALCCLFEVQKISNSQSNLLNRNVL
jgi:hypothetical protein